MHYFSGHLDLEEPFEPEDSFLSFTLSLSLSSIHIITWDLLLCKFLNFFTWVSCFFFFGCYLNANTSLSWRRFSQELGTGSLACVSGIDIDE